MRVLYLVHDLNDAAVARRVAMLAEGGAKVELAGFWRGARAPETVAGAKSTALAKSFDAQLARRAAEVIRAVQGAGRLAETFAPPDVILARNLEMLAIGQAISKKLSGRPKVVYECLDIHRLMLNPGLKGRIMRTLERQLLRATPLLIVSSPAFIENYFRPTQGYAGATLLVENKTPAGPSPGPRPPGPPWRIGWFGMLRCSRSLQLLKALAAGSQGRIEVLIAGRPAYDQMPDFDAEVADAPGVTFAGAYKVEDLATLYSETHFAWAIDYFEEGLNSAWLLPNRLYEGQAHGAVPIALKSVQTGRWLADHGCGLLIDDPSAELAAKLASLDGADVKALADRVAALPRQALVFGKTDCEDLVARLAESTR